MTVATLTTAQKTYLRNSTGDTDTTDPYLSDDYLQYLYDNNADSDLDSTVYYAIEALMGIASQKVSTSNQRTGDSKSAQQWFDHLERMLARWGSKTGLSSSTATIGTINLGIDEENSEFDIT